MTTTRKRPDVAERNRTPEMRVRTPEHRAAISATLKGRRKTPEHVAKVAAALRGRKQSAESVAKRVAARRSADGYGVKHGHASPGLRTPTYMVWGSMIQRCTNPNNSGWPDYGARGISVCERWLTFENFLADMGERPDGLSIDRVDNNGNYEPGNCRWATASQQQRNRRRPVYYDRGKPLPMCGHPNREHKARGMCDNCYRRALRRERNNAA